MNRAVFRACTALATVAFAAACSLVSGIADYDRCPGGKKLCEGRCEADNDPLLGCGDRTSCAPCRLPNVLVAACGGVACAVGQCAPGFGDCNGDPADGCEAQLTEGDVCPDRCRPGFADCNGDGVCECGYPNSNAVCGAEGGAAGSGECRVTGCGEGFFDCNNQPEDGCEVNLRTDGRNCGKCGASCQGGTCGDGRCLPVKIADNQPSPGQILFDEAYVYWSNYFTQAQGGSAVRRVSRDGLSENSIADNQPFAYGIAIAGDYVFYTTGRFGNAAATDVSVLGRARKRGDDAANPEVLLRIPGRFRGVAFEEPFVYFAVYDYVADAGTTGGIDGPGIYRFNRGTIGADAGPGAQVTVEKLARAARPMNLVVSGNDILWTEEGATGAAAEGAVKKCPQRTGCVGAEVRLGGGFRPRGIGVDAEFVYWVNVADARNGTPSTVVRARRDGSGAEQVLAGGINDARELAVDDAFVYFAAYTGNGVYRAAKTATGGAPEVILENAPPPGLSPDLPVAPLTVAVDQSFVYWSNYGSMRDVQIAGSVMRLVKP